MFVYYYTSTTEIDHNCIAKQIVLQKTDQIFAKRYKFVIITYKSLATVSQI